MLSEAYEQVVSMLRRARLPNVADGDDVAQDVCVRLLQLKRPETIKEPVRYLLRIARNLVVDRHRSRLRASVLFESLGNFDSHADASCDPERILTGRQQLQIVMAAIEQLSPRCRHAFSLHRFAGLSYAATARRMGISISMVEKHIADAMLRLANAVAQAEKIK
jgi:RNA polymerase sigma factor (sigma-70 family)